MPTTTPRSPAAVGASLCLFGAIAYLVSAGASLAIFKDPAIAADFDGGTKTADMGAVGILAALCAVVGGLLTVGSLWRGPGGARIAAALVLCFVGLPVSGAAFLALLLSQALPTS
jgi:hypothetical protein